MTNYHNNLAKKNSYFTFKICFTVTFSFKNITVIPFSQLQCNLEKFYLQIFFKFNWLIRIVDYISPLHFTELASCLKWQFLCITKNNLPAASHSVLCISIVFFRVITLFKKISLSPQHACGKGSLLNLFTDQETEAPKLPHRHWRGKV